MTVPRIAVTVGEPAGIGPDICLALADAGLAARIVVFGDRDLLQARARQLGIAIDGLDIRHVPLRAPVVSGRLDPANARYVLDMLDAALAGCASGEFAAMVTAPVHKGVINDAGIPFTGHTEYLAEKTHTPRVVMMLAGTGELSGLRVALATTHLPLQGRAGGDHRRQNSTTTLRILHADLVMQVRHRQAAHPRGRAQSARRRRRPPGHARRSKSSRPVLDKLRAEGMNLVGPLPADTLFTRNVLAGSDAQLAMYHDQGLAVLKYAAFEEGINITLGLPILRTSVDHGTALDLAGTGRADPRSLFAAVRLAAEIVGAAMKDHAARKRFGQNFLVSPGIIRKIVEAIAPRRGRSRRRDRPRPRRADRAAAGAARPPARGRDRSRPDRPPAQRYPPERLTIHEGDALAFDFASLGHGPARGRQPALQHFDAAAVPSGRCSPMRCATCTSCCKRKSSTAWSPSPARPTSAGCR